MLCCEVMKRRVYSAHGTMSATAGAMSMLENRVGFLPIVDDFDHPIGVVTDRDLTLRVCAKDLSASETLLGEVMTKDPVRCSEQATVEFAQSLMLQRQTRRILIVDDDDRLVGLVTLADLMHLLKPFDDPAWLKQTSEMRFRIER